jgi:hypothetical protein
MKTFPVVAILLAAITLASCAEKPDEISISTPENMSQENRSKSAEAVRVFMEKCPALAKYSSDITAAKVDYIRDASGYTEGREYGWKSMVELAVSVSANPQYMPKEFEAEGQTCYYRMGGGQNPGIAYAKAPCKRICGAGSDFSPVPELGMVGG